MAFYRRLTLMEREELSRMLAAGYSLRATAQVLQRAPSTVSRERKLPVDRDSHKENFLAQ